MDEQSNNTNLEQRINDSRQRNRLKATCLDKIGQIGSQRNELSYQTDCLQVNCYSTKSITIYFLFSLVVFPLSKECTVQQESRQQSCLFL